MAATEHAEEELWLYVDTASGQQKGPLAAAVLKRLLRRGLLQPQQFVWTPRLGEWTPLAAADAFADYCAAWRRAWFFMADGGDSGESGAKAKQRGPVATKELLALFLDGEVDGLTLVWTEAMSSWQPMGEVAALKEFLRDANEDQEREEELLTSQSRVAAEDQVFKDAKVEAFVAEDGKQYVFDTETKKWVTPADKIEEDLEMLRTAATGPLLTAAEETDSKSNGAASASTGDGAGSEETTPSAADAHPQEALGVATGGAADSDPNSREETKRRKKKPKKKKSDKWQKSKSRTWVYVNGLPLDATVQEVHDHFVKCGVIQQDLVTGAPRIKLYENREFGGLNGDASVCYMKEASVELAVQLLDKSQIRPEYDKGNEFVKRKKVKLDSRAKVKKFEQEKALSWNEGENDDRNGLRIVVIKHMFTPDEIEDEAYENELRDDILAECLKLGEVAKITLFAKHADGVVVIKFESAGSAATCVDVMNGRFFAGRRLECSFWDGTDYTYRESKDEEKERADKFSEWLEQGSSSSEEEDGEEEDDDDDEPAGSAEAARKPPSLEAALAASSAADSGASAAAESEAVHAGRVMPNLDQEEEEESDEDDVEQEPPASEAVHAGRVMPDLDDSDDDD
ncbi:hypothetical protein PybrP1_007338 [[Pythium] brassicae (nom. inval.)]|nr:hypothetical protein PybrP1_007338 [[Pythium] brassicae (nom. inval.)]